tara:strand:+ start:66 stop:239 length:174 start_codon:yes stop_codon:yes gene_type:complete
LNKDLNIFNKWCEKHHMPDAEKYPASFKFWAETQLTALQHIKEKRMCRAVVVYEGKK